MQRLRDQLLSSGSTSLLPPPQLPLPLQNRSVRNLLLSITLGLLSASGAWAQEEEFPGEKIVHLFDEVARQMPEGVYLNGLKQQGTRVEVRGVAQSSTRVSALMRQIDASEWMDDPEVDRVETTQAGSSRQAEFVVYLKQISAGSEGEEMLP